MGSLDSTDRQLNTNPQDQVQGPPYPENIQWVRPDGYELPQQWHSQRKKIRVACIGTGPSGIALAYKMERQMEPGTWELTLFEKNDDFGGTWYENRYPGCACDIPAHIYTYSWDPNPEWDTFFAHAGPILQYFRTFVAKHDLTKYMRLDSQVVSATWDAALGRYHLFLRNPLTGQESTDWSHVLVNATGNLNTWKWPDIRGLHDFQGPKMHSAHWDESVDFKDKTVAIIGTGSTAIQIVPQLQKVAGKLKLIMRSPTWVSPPFANDVFKNAIKGGEEGDRAHRQYYFSKEEKEKFRKNPESLLSLRRQIEAEINMFFELYTRGTDLQKKILLAMREEMDRRIGPGHEYLKSRLIPDWLPGCRRITPGDGYLEALTQSNVECIFQGIKEITTDALIDESGVEHKVDIIVCATGVSQVGWFRSIAREHRHRLIWMCHPVRCPVQAPVRLDQRQGRQHAGRMERTAEVREVIPPMLTADTDFLDALQSLSGLVRPRISQLFLLHRTRGHLFQVSQVSRIPAIFVGTFMLNFIRPPAGRFWHR
jgi:cation diffusion facilitator CzcD-associated flavoprotein CzcO